MPERFKFKVPEKSDNSKPIVIPVVDFLDETIPEFEDKDLEDAYLEEQLLNMFKEENPIEEVAEGGNDSEATSDSTKEVKAEELVDEAKKTEEEVTEKEATEAAVDKP